jgi:hypothetical protein
MALETGVDAVKLARYAEDGGRGRTLFSFEDE